MGRGTAAGKRRQQARQKRRREDLANGIRWADCPVQLRTGLLCGRPVEPEHEVCPHCRDNGKTPDSTPGPPKASPSIMSQDSIRAAMRARADRKYLAGVRYGLGIDD